MTEQLTDEETSEVESEVKLMIPQAKQQSLVVTKKGSKLSFADIAKRTTQIVPPNFSKDHKANVIFTWLGFKSISN